MALSILQVSKIYANGVKALDNLTIESVSGMFGLLGPNGAGKSSLMRTIATLQAADSGQLFFDDLDVMKNPMGLRKLLGYLPQDFGVYPGESAESMLDYFALLKGIYGRKDRKRIVDRVLDQTNLNDVRKKQVSTYSGGMKRRFGIAQLLLNDPRLIIVDEPTAGLDPAERVRFLNVIRAISTENTVILSTHIVADVKELCQDMAIINEGRVILRSTPEAGINNLDGSIWTLNIRHDQLPLFEENHQVLSSSYNSDNTLTLRIFDTKTPKSFSSENTPWKAVKPDLNDVYFTTLNSANTDV